MESITIKVRKDYYERHQNLYTNNKVTFYKGVNVITGCNGTGKSTLIDIINNYLDENNYCHINYDNTGDQSSSRMFDTLMYKQNYSEVASFMSESEGERIHHTMTNFINNIYIAKHKLKNEEYKKDDEPLKYVFKRIANIAQGKEEYKYADPDTIFITYDAIDSGSSIDNIIEYKAFFKTVINEFKEKYNIDIFIIISTNNFEFCKDERCIDVPTLKERTFNTYDEYKKYILQSSKKKDRRNETWNRVVERELAKEKEVNSNSEENNKYSKWNKYSNGDE